MAIDEANIIAVWRRFLALVADELLTRHHGRLVKSLGDGLLIECGDAADGLRIALQLASCLRKASEQAACVKPLRLRTGVHVCEVHIDQMDVYGSGVNLAARLVTLASDNGVTVSLEVRDEAYGHAEFDFADLGNCFVKGLEQPLRAFAATSGGGAVTPLVDLIQAELRPTIAIVPFATLQQDPESRALGDAFADDLISALSRSSSLRVLSRLSTAAFRELGEDLSESLRQRLRASYAVLGNLHAAKDRAVSVRAQLIELQSGSVIWTGSFKTSAADLFAAEDPVVPALSEAIARGVAAYEVGRTQALPIPNLTGYTMYVGGVTMLHRLSAQEFQHAHALLTSLTERIPRSAPPFAMLAKWHIFRIVQGWSEDRPQDGARARDAARRALERDPSDAFSMAVDGLAASIVEGDLDVAERRYRSAIAANANEPYAWALLASLYSYRDCPDEAVAAARQAVTLSPLDPARFLLDAHHALALLVAGRYDDAVSAARDSLKANALHTPSHRLLIIALMLAGKAQSARDAAVRHGKLEPRFTVATYRRRYPGRDSLHADIFARALRDAGVPG